MRRTLRFVSVAALMVAPMVVGFAAPAGAHTAAGFTVARVSPAAVPNTNVTGAGATLAYKPKKLTADVFSQAQCQGAKPPTSFTISNLAAKKVTITAQGKNIFVIPPQHGLALCVYGVPGKLTLGLKGSTHTLKVTLLAD